MQMGMKVFVLIYVNDMLITGSDMKLIQETRIILQTHFKIKDRGELRFFLGIKFSRNSEGI